jgi:baculoviral IAP repeat-containing protein 2/3
MAGLLDRLSSFYNWPTDHSFSPVVLANAGFRYTGCGDRVTCPVCGIEIEGWESRRLSSPRNEHVTRSPNCSLALACAPFNNVSVSVSTNEVSSNQLSSHSLSSFSDLFTAPTSVRDPIFRANGYDSTSPRADNQYMNTKPAVSSVNAKVVSNSPRARVTLQSDASIDRNNPDFGRLKFESLRLSTYHDWPAEAHVQPPELAADGWFYTGQNDRVCCAFCRGVLHHWSKDDKPTTEHRRHFPKCPFVQGRDVGNVALGQRTVAAPENGVTVAAANHTTNVGSEVDRIDTNFKTSDTNEATGSSNLTKNGAAFGGSDKTSGQLQQHKNASTKPADDGKEIKFR